MYSQMCHNGDELFHLEVGQDWQCQFDTTKFDDLAEVLMGKPTT